MRKNRTKHEAKKPRLAKRALALCFALIFVCSCLLPVFAHGEENLLAGTQGTVAEQSASSEQPTNDPAPLNEGSEDSALLTGNGTNPTEGGEEPKPAEQESKADEPKNEELKTEETKNEGTTESKDSTEEQPKTEGTTEQPKTEGTTEESKDSTEEPKQPTTNTTGDTINQGEATYTYRFWPDKIDAFDLEAINAAVKKGDSLNEVAQARVNMVPCTILTVKNNANLRDYQANVQQPTKDGYEFKGWYTIENGTNYDFSLDQNVNDIEESKTIDVFAKWVSVAEKNAEKYRGWYENLVNTSDGYMLGELAAEYFADKDFYSYLGSLPENEQAELWEKLEPVNMPEVDEAELEDEAVSLEDEGIALLSITAPAKQITVGKKLILTSNKKAHQGWRYWQADHSWTTSNPAVAKVESGKLYQTEKAVVTGMAAGTATITHTIKWWYYDKKGNRVDDSTEYDYYDVTVVTQTLGGDDKAAVFLLKTPTSDPKSNAPAEWAPNDGAIRWIGEVNVYGALWENNKNINSYAAQHVTKWPDGTTGSVWTLTKTDKTFFGNSGKTYFEDVRDMIFDQYKTSIEDEIRKNNPTLSGSINLTKEDITQIKVTPYKISRNNRSDPDMHIDCTIDVVNDKVYTAKFWVLEPGATSYTQVDAASYLKQQQVAKTSKRTVGSTKPFDGINYVLKGWYKENTQHKGAPDDLDAATGTRILESQWDYSPSNAELKDGTVNFYAEYVPDNSATEDRPYIIVEKEVKGLTNVDLLRSDFCITINGTEYPVSSKYGDFVTADEGFKIRWKIFADAGTYTVDEKNYDVSGYKVVKDGIGTVTTKTPDINFSTPVIHPSCSNQDFTVKSTAQEEIIFVIALHTGQQDTNLVISYNPLSAGVREAIKGKLNSTFMGSGDWNNSKTEFYSIKTNGEKFVVANTIVTYNETTGKIHIGEKCNWTKTATLEWSKSGGINPEISITNTYTPATLDIQITKQVNSGDTTKDFKFKVTSDDFSTVNNVSLTNRDGTSQKPQEWFYLKDGESATLHGLKKDYIFTIEEEKENSVEYDTTATENIKVEAGNTKFFRYKVVEENGQLVLQPIAEKGNSLLSGKLNITDGKVVVTNSAAATSLTVTKNVVEGNAKAPDNAGFTFRLTVSNDVKVYSKVKLTKKGNDITESSVQSNKYQWEFTLKNGESVHISGIRIDDENVKVEEIINDSHYTTKYKVGTDAEMESTTAAIPTATLSANQNSGTTVEFTNTYNIPKLNSMTIKKVVTGAFGERTKDFTFKVELTDANNLTVRGVNHSFSNPETTGALTSFKLKHGEYVTLDEIPIGTTITVTESDAKDYDTKATNYDKANDKTFVYEVVNENGKAVLKSVGTGAAEVKDSAIIVENDFDGNPDTGVLLDTLPYLILLAVAVAGGVLVVVRKRKHRDE